MTNRNTVFQGLAGCRPTGFGSTALSKMPGSEMQAGVHLIKHLSQILMKSALLIIDVQRGLFDPEPQPYEAAAVIARINLLAEKARHAGMPVIFIQHERSDMLYGSEAWQLEPGLQICEGDHIVRKSTPDSFLDTRLAGLLQQLQVTHLTVCGYASEFCVDTTIRRAAALGFPVLLAADAHTTHDKPHASAVQIRQHENATLPDITSFGPEIRAQSSAEIVF